jgi:class 3 adenylate cyclase/tetratricopeptide (TPR) repeat protein
MQPNELRKTVTVLFGDLADSTGLGERLDPELLRGVMSRYYGEMRSALEQHGGTVTKLMGDAVLAVFGIPTVHEDDALRAVRAACEMKRALEQLNIELEQELAVTLQLKVAVNTGEVVVPARPREEDFIVADVVNVAARLEQAAAPGEVLLGEDTYRVVRDAVRVEATVPLDLKGKSKPVSAFRLLEVLPGAPPFARLDSPLVGRAQELEMLGRCFERAVEGRTCVLVTVLGSAGIGKSRLVEEFSGGLRDRARIVEGRCLPYGDGITFWPIAEIVREAAAISDDDSPDAARSKIAALVPQGVENELVVERLAATLGMSRAVSQPEETFWAIRMLLEGLAGERPLVVVFEDIHWGEETFLDLVEYLAGFITKKPLLVLSVARLDLLELRPSWSRAIEGAASLPLHPLGEEETRGLIRGLLGQEQLAAAAEHPINRAAQGNPLFVEEMLRMLVDDGQLTHENGEWVPANELIEVSTPPSIQALLAARIDRLESDQRAVLERASIVGEEFWAGAVATLCPESKRPAVWSHLQAMVRKQLVRAGGTPFGGDDAFTFTHILIRDSAYEGILKETRAELHERFADWLEEKAGERIAEYEEIVGYHLEQAYRYRQALGQMGEGLAARAADSLASAGKRAHARGDMPAAVKLLERSLSLQGEGTEEGLELMLVLSHALSELELARADELLGEISNAAAAQGNRRLQLRVGIERDDLSTWTKPEVDLDGLRRRAEEAIDAFQAFGDEIGMAKSLRNLATFHGFAGRWGEAGELLERALSHARDAGDQQVIEEMLPGVAGALCVGPVPADEAIQRLERIVADVVGPGEGNGTPGIVSRGTRAAVDVRGLAGLAAMQGRFDEARALCARARQDLEQIGQTRRLADVAQVAAWIEMVADAPAAAERELRFSYETLKGMGETAVLSTIAAELAEALYAQGRYDEVEQLTEESAQLASRDDVESQVRWRTTRAKLFARRGNFHVADALVEEAVRRAADVEYPDLYAGALISNAEVLRLEGREEQAARSASRAILLYEDKGNLARAAKARGLSL